MEPAKIDWESIESVFVIDQAFENINAPQWFDFLLDSSLSPHPHPDDDDAWFCRPDCKHPKTAEDFLKSTPTSKLLRSVSVSKLIGLGDWTRRRETNLKRRGLGQTATSSNADDDENQNPNFSTPVHQKTKPCKAAIKSSAQKEDGLGVEEEDEYSEILLRSEEDRPKLKSTQSARDLFGGRDLFGKITEFCNELKKMASRPKEREDDQEVANDDRSPCLKVEQKPLLGVKEENGKAGRVVLGERKIKATTVNEKDKERKPFLEVSKDRYEAATPKQKLRKNKRADEDENIPISLNLKEMKCKEEERLLPIRTNPPTPQGFSATRDPAKTTPSKPPKSRLTEREILQERDQRKTLREELGENSNNKSASPMANKEGRALDVFWFLKPCTL